MLRAIIKNLSLNSTTDLLPASVTDIVIYPGA